jgi:hypothetical protein
VHSLLLLSGYSAFDRVATGIGLRLDRLRIWDKTRPVPAGSWRVPGISSEHGQATVLAVLPALTSPG